MKKSIFRYLFFLIFFGIFSNCSKDEKAHLYISIQSTKSQKFDALKFDIDYLRLYEKSNSSDSALLSIMIGKNITLNITDTLQTIGLTYYEINPIHLLSSQMRPKNVVGLKHGFLSNMEAMPIEKKAASNIDVTLEKGREYDVKLLVIADSSFVAVGQGKYQFVPYFQTIIQQR